MPVIISGAVSGATTLQATDAVTATITLPSATDTLVGKATTDTLTNKTLTLPVVGTTIGVGAATPSASGAGITFPATQSASTDANTLDDYEEGTWTPVTTTAGATYTVQTGVYTKIGRQVTVLAYIAWSAHTGAGANLVIGGLPFTASATATYTPGFLCVSNALPAGRDTLYNYILPSTANISAIAHDSTAVLGDASVLIAATGNNFISYVYFV